MTTPAQLALLRSLSGPDRSRWPGVPPDVAEAIGVVLAEREAILDRHLTVHRHHDGWHCSVVVPGGAVIAGPFGSRDEAVAAGLKQGCETTEGSRCPTT